jgi:hypothetical protein
MGRSYSPVLEESLNAGILNLSSEIGPYGAAVDAMLLRTAPESTTTEPHRATRVLSQVVPVLCPILFAAFPLLSLFTQNQSELELSVLWWPLAVCVAAAVASYGVFGLVTRSAAKAGALASLLVVAFWYYGPFADKASVWGVGEGRFLALWLAVLVVGIVALLRTRHSLRNLTLILGVGAAVLALPRAASIVAYQVNHPSLSASDPRLWPTALQKPVLPAGAARPDIYVIIPDDYARTDVLQRYFRHDNTAFVRRLQRRGFVVSEQSRSPYADSESNIAAALNMDYLSAFPRVLGKTSQDVRPVKRVMEDNRASRLLGSVGYRFVHLDTDDVTYAGGNPDIPALAPPDGFPNLWMRKSVLRQVGGALGFDQQATDERFRTGIGSVFSRLAAVPAQPGPKFVVFHTLLPHDPYIFGAQGQRVTFPGHSDEDLASTLGRAYYLRQLEFSSRRLLDSVDQILAHSKTPPVVVIQSDEGFQANPEPFGEAAMLDIRAKGFTALYLPGRGPARVPEPPNTVNTLRFVMNRYLGTHYDMLRSASYPEGDLPYDFHEMRVK